MKEGLATAEIGWIGCAEAQPEQSSFADLYGRKAALLARAGVVTDSRGDRLRFGFGIYHDDGDVDELLRRVASVASAPEGHRAV